MKVKRILTMALATIVALEMASNMLAPNTFYAKETSDSVSYKFYDDNKTTDTVETADVTTFILDESQMTEEQLSKYEQMMSGERYELEVGESVIIGSDDEGVISIKCVSN